jgi:hypothetical protein
MLEHLGQHSDLHLAFEQEHSACHGCMHSQLQHSALVRSMRHSNRALPASLRQCAAELLYCCSSKMRQGRMHLVVLCLMRDMLMKVPHMNV